MNKLRSGVVLVVGPPLAVLIGYFSIDMFPERWVASILGAVYVLVMVLLVVSELDRQIGESTPIDKWVGDHDSTLEKVGVVMFVGMIIAAQIQSSNYIIMEGFI